MNMRIGWMLFVVMLAGCTTTLSVDNPSFIPLEINEVELAEMEVLRVPLQLKADPGLGAVWVQELRVDRLTSHRVLFAWDLDFAKSLVVGRRVLVVKIFTPGSPVSELVLRR